MFCCFGQVLHFFTKGRQNHENLHRAPVRNETSVKRDPAAYLVKKFIIRLDQVHDIHPFDVALTIPQGVQLWIGGA